MHHFLLAISVISLAIAVGAFMSNVKPRGAINLALKPMKTPERLKSYDAEALTKVAQKLKSASAGTDGTMLDLYIRPVLLRNDIIFAVALAIFSATLWIWVIVHFELSGLLRHMITVLTASAVLYGVSDVAEDVMLARLFRQSDAISSGEGRVACGLTQLKLIAIIGSVSGALVFETLSWLTSKRQDYGAIH